MGSFALMSVPVLSQNVRNCAVMCSLVLPPICPWVPNGSLMP